MADLERPRIRSVIQQPQSGSSASHWSRKDRSRSHSRSRSRSPHERRDKREDKENREELDQNEDRERRRRRREEEREYHKRRREEDDTDRYRERHRESHRRRRDDERGSDRGRSSYKKREHSGSDDEAGSEKKDGEPKEDGQTATNSEPTRKKADPNNPLLSRTGGAYIPPAKLKMMQENIADKSSEAYQRLSWEALKKSINGLINKVNISNIAMIVRELFQENIVRGRGVLAQSIIRAQAASPTFTHVYAALVAIINTKFPKNGELILRRLVLLFRRSYRRNAKAVCLSASRFIAHLVNQQVAHEILALETLTLLLHKPTDDSVEVAIGFLKEGGLKLTEVSPRGVNAVFERLRSILHSGDIDNRVQYMIEVMFAIRKDGFKDYPSVAEGLDLVEEEDQITHLLRLEEAGATEDILNIFKVDPNFLENEEKYKEIKRDILGEGGSDDSSGDEDGDSDEDDDDEDEDGGGDEGGENKMTIMDQTETNLVALRRTVYLTIQSSLDFEECAHKLLKMQFKPEHLPELCKMIVDCCSQQRSYEKFFGLLAQRFCQLKKEYIDEFMKIFQEQYESIHRLETNKLRNVAKLFAHLFYSDAIPWTVLACIKLNEDDTTSSSRVFIKILFQELAEYMGMQRLNERLKDPFLVEYFEGIFPRDNPRNTRFSINFFTTIGLGGVTDELRVHLKNAPKMIMAQKRAEESDSDSSDSSESSSEDSSSSEESSSEESSSDSDDSRDKRRRKKRTPPKKSNRKERGRESRGDKPRKSRR